MVIMFIMMMMMMTLHIFNNAMWIYNFNSLIIYLKIIKVFVRNAVFESNNT